ncbi:MAG: hypothetical protein HYR98_05810, partial [Nitrospirae bacterium]|nr:hypothetical protein [Nitrospirota bacterium]
MDGLFQHPDKPSRRSAFGGLVRATLGLGSVLFLFACLAWRIFAPAAEADSQGAAAGHLADERSGGALSPGERGTARLLLGRQSIEGRRYEEAERLFR